MAEISRKSVGLLSQKNRAVAWATPYIARLTNWLYLIQLRVVAVVVSGRWLAAVATVERVCPRDHTSLDASVIHRRGGAGCLVPNRRAVVTCALVAVFICYETLADRANESAEFHAASLS